ncbi:hypothetical protein EOW77_0035240 [Bradyrhizobium yuanmingense]|uniref:transposase n=1 Tax=Bradyrhizobium yuanmingense TaxID=108015 RepID=UPI000FE2E1DA|nr:transposase [Bradyrhizobium yuanmingense]TGN73352.1 hypothetical protein EOW77_0035240 [Bradyrhizobium yuanmingense]
MNEGEIIEPQVDEVEAVTGVDIKTVSAPMLWSTVRSSGAASTPWIPAKAEPIRSVPLRRFRYDAKHDILKCPQARILRPARPVKRGRFFYSKAKDCARGPLKGDCLSKGRGLTKRSLSVTIVLHCSAPADVASDRARQDRRLYQRHRWRSEGFHGEAKTRHGLASAIRRGLANMKIQAYLTAVAINLKGWQPLSFRFFALDRLPSTRRSPASRRVLGFDVKS